MVIPRRKGERTSPQNLVLACEECNVAKADLLPLDFFMTRASRPVPLPWRAGRNQQR